eukprot:3736173-Prymnesium_polylepis.1
MYRRASSGSPLILTSGTVGPRYAVDLRSGAHAGQGAVYCAARVSAYLSVRLDGAGVLGGSIPCPCDAEGVECYTHGARRRTDKQDI